MSLINAYVEQSDLGRGRFRHEIAIRPIAVRENGSLLRMAQDFADGDATFPNVVSRAPLRVRTANDGMRRLLPVPGRDDLYLEMGAPFVQVGGVWTQVSLGTPSRTGHTLTWTRPQTITTVVHGGHYLDMQIELLNGFVPENSRIAFPVGLNGLTRSDLNILNGGTTVARLRPFQMVDAANPFDRRPIPHAFTTRNGQPFLVLTLPSLIGMVRPVIDPTIELQPDGTAGLDTRITGALGANQTVNYGTDTVVYCGLRTGVGDAHFLIKFDLSTLPDAAVISAATLSLYFTEDFAIASDTFSVYRLKRAWVETQATWLIYSTGNSWSTAGAAHADDREQTDIGTRAIADNESLNAFKDFSLTPTSKSALDLGNGWLMKGTGAECLYGFRSSDHATATNRPKLTVEYTEAAGGRMMLLGTGR